jgi:hypothetical protein
MSLFPASRPNQGPSKQLCNVKCVLPLILSIRDINLTITLKIYECIFVLPNNPHGAKLNYTQVNIYPFKKVLSLLWMRQLVNRLVL